MPFVAGLVLAGAPQSEASVSQCYGAPGVGLCLAGTDPCEVTSNFALDNNTILDCGQHDLVIKNGLGKLTVNGKLTIRAKNLTVENTRSIETQTSTTSPMALIIELTGSLSVTGQLTAQNAGGGTKISVTATQNIVLEPRDGTGIDVTGVGQSSDGGELRLQAGQNITIGSKILANGDDGTSSANQNSGGEIDLVATTGSVYVNHLIRAYGRWFNGGHLSIEAGGNVEINHDGASSARKGELELDGHGIDGDGGIVDIRAGGSVLQSGPVSVAGGVGNVGGNAQGGMVRIDAGCGGVRLEDTVNAWGGLQGGGVLTVESRGNVAVAGEVWLDAKKLGGNGGDATFRSSKGNVVFEGAAKIHANGDVSTNSTEGVGGTVSTYGCQIDVASGALIESTGQTKGQFMATSYKRGTELQNSFGIRVSENADVSAYSTGGKIRFRTPTVVTGTCSNSGSTTCTLDSDCDGINCTTGNCIGGNPQTDGQVVQFSTVPVVEQDAALRLCATSCQ